VTDHATSSPPAKLTYAPPPPWYRGRTSRRIATGIGLLALAAVIALWAPTWILFLELKYYGNQCLKYAASPSAKVHETKGPWPRSDGRSTTTISLRAECFVRFAKVARVPVQGSTAFLHERQTPSGNRRLVAIHAVTHAGLRNDSILFEARIFYITSVFKLPHEVHNQFIAPFMWGSDSEAIFAGQVDPNDQSHFTILTEDSTGETVLDCWLMDDDTVKIEPRRQNVTPAPPPSPASSR
jgi:hypothetical protein